MQCNNLYYPTFVKRLKYFGNHSSLHGIKHVLNTDHIPHIHRCIWIIFVFISAFGMLYILHQGTGLFEKNAISFIPETTYIHWDTDFPAVTICEAVDNDKLRDYYEENDIPIKLTTFYKEILFLDSQHYCRSCSSCNKIGCPNDFLDIIKKYRTPCNETLVRCSWSGQVFNCCDRFISMKTEYGECFVFNSAHFEGKRMHLSNRLTGPGYLKFAAMETIMIDIHSPDDIIFSNFDKQIVNGKDGDVQFGSEFELRFKVEETSNEEEVHEVPSKIRGCLFSHELEESEPSVYTRYSYSACIVQCRARRQLATCNCTHYMLPRMAHEPICNISGLICLTKLAEDHIDEEDIDFECGCLPSCEEPNYQAVIIKNSPNIGELTNELIDRGTLVSIYMECLPSTRIRRLVVRSSLDYVVFVGGTAGIFFGASILSVLEIFYLMLIRK